MIREIIINPWAINNINDWVYDAYIATVGYESRARYISEMLKPKSTLQVASAFTENNELDFEKNYNWYKNAGFETPSHTSKEFKFWAQKFINNLKYDESGKSRILIDISSMSRFRIAALVWSLATSPVGRKIVVDFVYALAEHNPPPKRTGPILKRGPVLSEFAGWFEDPGAPCAAIIGLGYDLGKAVSTIEYIEPGETWAMFPIGEDARYEKSVKKTNKIFIDTIDNDRIIKYDVIRPYETFHSLESLVSGVLRYSKPIVIPFGPKILTLNALLIALLKYPRVSIWRVSSDKYESVSNRIPNGTVVGMRIEFISK